jgi:hypothetical protein
MKAKEFIPATKPRNFVAKNQKTAGAGPHKDKKRAGARGDIKHKAKQYEEGVAEGDYPDGSSVKTPDSSEWQQQYQQAVDKVNNAKTQQEYEAASERAGKIKDFLASKGIKVGPVLGKGMAEGTPGNDFRVGQRVIYTTGRGEKFPSIVTAVDFDEDAVKIKSANNKPFPNSGGDIEIVVDPGWKFLTPEPGVDPNSVIAVSPSMRKTTERVRDPEDWDEGNTEPPNNFAVYINGKKWKVFKGRGQYADDDREQAHYEQLKGWARKKSEETGKKWEISITGEGPTA